MSLPVAVASPIGTSSSASSARMSAPVAALELEDGHPPSKEEEKKKCCCCCCTRSTCSFVAMYLAVVVVFAVLAAFTGPAGLALFALAPGAVIWYHAEKWYWPSITRCSMFEVVGLATLILAVPLTIAISVLDAFLPVRDSCDAPRAIPFWRYFFMAYVRAGVLEELLKYSAIRRLLFKAYVVDVRSLLVYGALAGATFGVLENVAYNLMGGLGTAILRSLVTVPLHTATGVLIASNLVPFRFVEYDAPPVGCALAVFHLKTALVATWSPILLHGTYDVLLFIASAECDAWMAALIVGAYVGAITFITYMTRVVTLLERRFPRNPAHNIHELIKQGAVGRPCASCWCCCPGQCACCPCCY